MKLVKLSANKSIFKTIQFRKGFNIIIADRDQDSSDKHSTNGLGKTLLLEIINYCLGGSPSETLKKEEMRDWIFSLTIEIDGEEIILKRAVKDRKKYVEALGIEDINVDEVCLTLGEKLFGLSVREVKDKSNHPTYRTLASYFMRTYDGAFSNPFLCFAGQKPLSRNNNAAFLIGLNWRLSVKFSQLKSEFNKLDNANKAIETGAFNVLGGTVGDLNSEKIDIELQLTEKMKRLENFQVHEDYRDIQTKADSLTEEIHNILNEIIINSQIVERYKDSLKNENGDDIRIEQIYEAAGAVFEKSSLRTLDEVINFHKDVVLNRKNYLESEIELYLTKNRTLDSKMEKLSNERAGYMNILKTHGALDEYTKLQDEVNKSKAKIADIESRITRLTEIESRIDDIRIEISGIISKMRQEYSGNQPLVSEAISLFNSNSRFLYEQPGTLSIDVGKEGYKFKIDIKKAGSDGVSSMKVFCYDLMLAEYWSTIRHREFPLFHDSKIFADVDPRQVAKALEISS
ncbi:MAG: DUF2326 domain-containing protein [Candidatus Saccharibacteria bacterium]|nr:DUF2326 domain-containing protein [Candidatus Saccharibacteria bacterium]